MELTPEECSLREQLLCVAGKVPNSSNSLSKEQIRFLHSERRLSVMASMNGFFDYHMDLLREHLACPNEIDISNIKPFLSIVTAAHDDSQIFNAASLLWSVPGKQGLRKTNAVSCMGQE